MTLVFLHAIMFSNGAFGADADAAVAAPCLLLGYLKR